ncbi:MAG: HRDC domain-containing protein [Verrucomicrobiales bacterium]
MNASAEAALETIPPTDEGSLITDDAGFRHLLDDLDRAAKASRKPLICAVDLEADSLHSYREKLCLVQLCCAGRLAILDPLKIQDLVPLLDFVERPDVELWMHGADFDMTLLKRTFSRVPPRIYDTQTAARLLGYRKFGLAYLIEDFFGVALSKSPQKADWGKRPLTDKMIEYAMNDVCYLPRMAQMLVGLLNEKGRWDWFLQSCDAAREAVMAREERTKDEAWKISGWGRLSPKGLAFLRALWTWRDRQAEILDRPSFKVMNNERLIELSLGLEEGKKIMAPPGRYRQAQVTSFRDAVREVFQMPKEEWPQKVRGKRPKPDPAGARRFDQLKARRDREAERHDLEESFIAAKGALERLAFSPDPPESFLLPWQMELLGLNDGSPSAAATDAEQEASDVERVSAAP